MTSPKSRATFNAGGVRSSKNKKYKDYFFSNSAKVNNEGGIVQNTCTLKMLGNNHFEGKSSSEYRLSGITIAKTDPIPFVQGP